LGAVARLRKIFALFLPSSEDRVFFAAMNFGIVRVRFNLAGLTHVMMVSLASLLLMPSHAQEFQFHSVGARIGFPAESTSNNFLQTEAFLDYNLWRWNLSTNWHLQSRVGVSAGWLGQRGDAAFIGTLGPNLELSRVAFPLSLEGGFNPTYISRYHFSSTVLGENVQFTSHIGLYWDVTSHWRVGYRFQHMSNAGIREPNPGFNLHVLSISYLF
jgi:hypothetical protein